MRLFTAATILNRGKINTAHGAGEPILALALASGSGAEEPTAEALEGAWAVGGSPDLFLIRLPREGAEEGLHQVVPGSAPVGLVAAAAWPSPAHSSRMAVAPESPSWNSVPGSWCLRFT